MFSKVYSGGLQGIDGYVVQVEADVSDGLPGFYMVGSLASEVKEAEERVRTAMRNAGFHLSSKKITFLAAEFFYNHPMVACVFLIVAGLVFGLIITATCCAIFDDRRELDPMDEQPTKAKEE